MIGISMGDPNGVGPELLLRAYQKKKLPVDIVAIADISVLEYCNDILKLKIPLHPMKGLNDFNKDFLNIYDLGVFNSKELSIGKVSEIAGKASLHYIREGTDLALKNEIDALVTLPVNKEAIRITLKNFSGHTGFIASLCNVTNYSMMLVTDKLIVSHVSTHVSLKEAIELVKVQRVLDVIRLTDNSIRKMKSGTKIAVAGLNPHAGESNAFGDEDIGEILPAIIQAKEEGIDVYGPMPADTVFYQAMKGKFDAVVCMYHDQGHIAVKILDFESAVNVTLGLPIIRTSVDHGTAYDIAYKGIASTSSLINACKLALKLK